MKKLLIAMLALITALSISLAACDKDKDKEPIEDDPDDDLVARPSDDETVTPPADDDNKGDNTTKPNTPTNTWETKNDTVYVLTDCNIRSSASTTSSKLGTAKLGDSFQRVESNDKWSKITYNNGTAYILNALITESAQRVTFDDKTAENKILHLKTDSSSYLRKSPVATEEANNIAGVIKDTHTAADTLKLVGLSQDGVWAKVSFTGNLGTDTNPQNFDGTEVLYIHVGNIVEFSTSGGGQLPG